MSRKIEIALNIVEMLIELEYIKKKNFSEYSDLILDIQDILSNYIDDKE